MRSSHFLVPAGAQNQGHVTSGRRSRLDADLMSGNQPMVLSGRVGSGLVLSPSPQSARSSGAATRGRHVHMIASGPLFRALPGSSRGQRFLCCCQNRDQAAPRDSAPRKCVGARTHVRVCAAGRRQPGDVPPVRAQRGGSAPCCWKVNGCWMLGGTAKPSEPLSGSPTRK